ncbi:hypothetical protein MYU51_007685 [Penicillium brevicompactum]|uniref:uncharacterized protein n=1 Tax=Penicillium brevicompactum TaxID=5074 RepID=UPI0025410351|nr:uncharacterized protein N7506_005886 [Penicillium brevicompactum]KAJ5332103.1 hypothetical protein N7506_005886 [Penicillium brevicompactum]
MLRRPAGKTLGYLGSRNLLFPRPLLSHAGANLPRFQSSWRSDKREAFDGQDSEHREQRRRRHDDDSKVTLDVDSLGKPGQIVVVAARRRPHLNDRRRKSERRSRDTISSILDDLDEESSTPSDSSVHESINATRGTYHIRETLPNSEFKAILSRLKSSFTWKQLSDYISAQKRNSDEDQTRPWTWAPQPKGKRSSPEKASESKGKARLAETIARDCWQLVVDGEIGRLDFPLSARFIGLLANAKHFSFHELANLHGCSIDIMQSTNLVSLTGRRNDCEAVVEIISDATTRTREEDVGISTHLNGDGNQVFTSDFLEWVNTTYGVLVEYKANAPPSKILYLAENKTGAENARRTLNLALFNTTSPSTPFSTYLPASELATAYSYRPEAHASWFERQKSWFRWAMSSSQNQEAELLDTPFFDKHQTRLSDELLKLLRKTELSSNLVSTNSLHESVTVTFGKCLFMQKPSIDNAPISPAELGRLSLPRIFTKDGPQVTQLMNALWPDLPRKDTESYRLRLIPTSNIYDFPELEVEVATETQLDGDFIIDSVKAIRGSNSVDYLLPENGSDLRFTRTITQNIWQDPYSNSHDTNMEDHPRKVRIAPEVEEMLQSIRRPLQDLFNATGSLGSPVPLSTFCHISLPQELACRFDPHDELDDANGPGQTENLAVEYMTLPLSDVRGSIVQKYDFDGRPLHYQYYDSGPFLASRVNEVSLLMPIPSSGSAPENEDSQELLDQEFHEFYNTACDMAFKINASRYAE